MFSRWRPDNLTGLAGEFVRLAVRVSKLDVVIRQEHRHPFETVEKPFFVIFATF